MQIKLDLSVQYSEGHSVTQDLLLGLKYVGVDPTYGHYLHFGAST